MRGTSAQGSLSSSADTVKYFRATKTKRIRNPFHAKLKIDGKTKFLGNHLTGEAVARAYDAVARTIRGRKLNFPNASSEALAALVR
jgi:hypothetical protein